MWLNNEMKEACSVNSRIPGKMKQEVKWNRRDKAHCYREIGLSPQHALSNPFKHSVPDPLGLHLSPLVSPEADAFCVWNRMCFVY